MNPPAWPSRLFAAIKLFARDTANGMLLVSHNGLAVLGLAAVIGLSVVAGQPDLRARAEQQVYGWLHLRHGSPAEGVATVAAAAPKDTAAPADDVSPLARATATDPAELTKPQAAVATWISRRYKVAPEPISRLVQEAWQVGQHYGVEPTLILAIMAVESSFNPFAQSSVGAQGLMQVMTKVHDKKYEAFGGAHAAFDPVTNLRVGVEVLKECIGRAGSVYDGLRHYVGAANMTSDGGYAGKVLGEHQNLKKIAAGVAVPHTTRIVPVPAPVRPADAAAAPAASGVQLTGLASEPTP
jgi:soluble lytic murein transglycosylase-like protein